MCSYQVYLFLYCDFEGWIFGESCYVPRLGGYVGGYVAYGSAMMKREGETAFGRREKREREREEEREGVMRGWG